MNTKGSTEFEHNESQPLLISSAPSSSASSASSSSTTSSSSSSSKLLSSSSTSIASSAALPPLHILSPDIHILNPYSTSSNFNSSPSIPATTNGSPLVSTNKFSSSFLRSTYALSSPHLQQHHQSVSHSITVPPSHSHSHPHPHPHQLSSGDNSLTEDDSTSSLSSSSLDVRSRCRQFCFSHICLQLCLLCSFLILFIHFLILTFDGIQWYYFFFPSPSHFISIFSFSYSTISFIDLLCFLIDFFFFLLLLSEILLRLSMEFQGKWRRYWRLKENKWEIIVTAASLLLLLVFLTEWKMKIVKIHSMGWYERMNEEMQRQRKLEKLNWKKHHESGLASTTFGGVAVGVGTGSTLNHTSVFSHSDDLMKDDNVHSLSSAIHPSSPASFTSDSHEANCTSEFLNGTSVAALSALFPMHPLPASDEEWLLLLMRIFRELVRVARLIYFMFGAWYLLADVKYLAMKRRLKEKSLMKNRTDRIMHEEESRHIEEGPAGITATAQLTSNNAPKSPQRLLYDTFSRATHLSPASASSGPGSSSTSSSPSTMANLSLHERHGSNLYNPLSMLHRHELDELSFTAASINDLNAFPTRVAIVHTAPPHETDNGTELQFRPSFFVHSHAHYHSDGEDDKDDLPEEEQHSSEISTLIPSSAIRAQRDSDTSSSNVSSSSSPSGISFVPSLVASASEPNISSLDASPPGSVILVGHHRSSSAKHSSTISKHLQNLTKSKKKKVKFFEHALRFEIDRLSPQLEGNEGKDLSTDELQLHGPDEGQEGNTESGKEERKNVGKNALSEDEKICPRSPRDRPPPARSSLKKSASPPTRRPPTPRRKRLPTRSASIITPTAAAAAPPPASASESTSAAAQLPPKSKRARPHKK